MVLKHGSVNTELLNGIGRWTEISALILIFPQLSMIQITFDVLVYSADDMQDVEP